MTEDIFRVIAFAFSMAPIFLGISLLPSACKERGTFAIISLLFFILSAVIVAAYIWRTSYA